MGNSVCGDHDSVLMERISYALLSFVSEKDVQAIAHRRKELWESFKCLSPSAAAPLLERLSGPHPDDELSVRFSRLSTNTRNKLLTILRDARRPLILKNNGSGLPPAAAEVLYQREVDAEVRKVLQLPAEERLILAYETLQNLRQIAHDPLLAQVNPKLLRSLNTELDAMERVVIRWRTQRYLFYQGPATGRILDSQAPRSRKRLTLAAAATIAILDGPEPGPADLVALVGLIIGFSVVANTASTFAPGRRERQNELLDEYVVTLQRSVQAVTANASRLTPKSTVEFPRPLDKPISPPVEETKKTKRRPCQTSWVPRVGGNRLKRYHNDFCEAMIIRMKLPVSPLLEYKVTTGGKTFTQFDTYDSSSYTYYDFKTRYEYIGDDSNPKAWMAVNGLFSDAEKQRMTLVNCGLEGDLVWIFDTAKAADAVRSFLGGGWPLDQVLCMPWSPHSKQNLSAENKCRSATK
ncbi:hypothetical protein ACFYE1_16405 [Kocuria sp. CPCC 205315]